MSQEARKEILGQLMDNLQHYVNQDVVIIYWEGGKLTGLKGKLQGVVPFDFINFEGKIINFAGVNSAIQMICLDEKNVLYYNAEVEAYQGFSFRDVMSLILAQEEKLGYSIKRAEIEESANIRK